MRHTKLDVMDTHESWLALRNPVRGPTTMIDGRGQDQTGGFKVFGKIEVEKYGRVVSRVLVVQY